MDVSHSVSRLMANIASEEHKQAAGKLRDVLARYSEAEDLINIGAYVQGSNKNIDYAVEKIEQVNDFLKQRTSDNIPFEQSVQELIQLFQ